MNFNGKEHSRFIQYLDRTAEKNPLLWLPCVLLITFALAAKHIAERAKIAYLHRNTEKVVREKPQFEKKPFFLRAVAVTVTAAFSLMLVPVTSFDAFGEEYDNPITEQFAFNGASETEEKSVPNEITATDETADTDEITVIEEQSATEETADSKEITVLEEQSATEETADSEEITALEEQSATEETADSEEIIVLEEQSATEETADTDETIEPQLGHQFSEDWSYNSYSHYHKCINPGCNEAIDSAAHTFGNVLTNEIGHYQKCTVCGYETDPKHRFESDWESNDIEHWHECVYCEWRKDVEAHDYEWDFYTSDQHCRACNVCGKVVDVGDHFVYKWGHNKDRHWEECICGERLSTGAHHFSEYVFTFDEDGKTTVKRYYCTSHCGYFYDEHVDNTHIHTPGDKWKHNNSQHWHECTSCGKKVDDAANHNYSIKVTLEPTETTTGKRVYTCTVCGYSYTQTIPELGHIHSFSTDWHKDENNHWHECTACGEHFDTASHNDNNVVNTVNPTATTAGIRTYSCSVCGYIMRTETIPPLNEPDPSYSANLTPSYPAIVSPANTTVKEPYIYGDTPKTGWDTIISDIDSAMDGDTVRVNMNGATELPQSVLLHIQNRSINLELNMGSTVWNINGFDVTNPKTVNLRVSERSNIIPANVIDNLISELEPKEYRLYHSGDFGFKATLTLNVAGKRYNGYYAALYHYNTKTKQLEFVDESLVENKQVIFELTHASDYAVAFNSIPMYDDVSSGAGVFENSVPIETSAMPETNGVTIPAVKLPQIMKYSNKKRRYRILRKRCLDDLVFVF